MAAALEHWLADPEARAEQAALALDGNSAMALNGLGLLHRATSPEGVIDEKTKAPARAALALLRGDFDLAEQATEQAQNRKRINSRWG